VLIFADRAATDVSVLGLPGVITSEGGLPLVLDGKIIGAVGASARHQAAGRSYLQSLRRQPSKVI
jgi:uncharacterized protein GlcG (DUF336 family)